MSDGHDSTDEPSGVPPSGDGLPESGAPPREDEVSLLDLLLVLVRSKALIIRTVLVFTLLGLTYSVLAPEQYTSTANLVQESQGEGGNIPGGLGGLAGGLAGGAISGILGGASSGLGPEALLNVMQGRAVRLAVVRDTFRFPEAGRSMTFVEHVSQSSDSGGILSTILKYTVELPWTLKDALGRALSDPPTINTTKSEGETVIPSDEEYAAMKAIEGKIKASIAQKTGLMVVSVTASHPEIASDLAESFIDHFRARVRKIRTEKVRERLSFLEGRFQEAEAELETAEDRLANFLERNQRLSTASLEFQRDRLRRQVSFKEQLYSKLQAQLTQTRLDLQRQKPVVTVVREPLPPRSRSAPQRTLIVLVSLILGGVFGVGGAFGWAFIENVEEDEEQRQKLDEVRKGMIPKWLQKESVST
jgi:uncharacterized protein involved in exopolysaccharide biosynthesis